MMMLSKGFTLLELMITVAIVGILAAVAIPAYSNYITRTQVSEAVALGASIQKPLNEFGWSYGSWPTKLVAPPTPLNEGELRASLSGKYTTLREEIGGAYPVGELVAEMHAGRAQGQTITFVTVDGGIIWSCSGGTLDPIYRPNACR